MVSGCSIIGKRDEQEPHNHFPGVIHFRPTRRAVQAWKANRRTVRLACGASGHPARSLRVRDARTRLPAHRAGCPLAPQARRTVLRSCCGPRTFMDPNLITPAFHLVEDAAWAINSARLDPGIQLRQVNFLLTWNLKHLSNAVILSRLKTVNRTTGLASAIGLHSGSTHGNYRV